MLLLRRNAPIAEAYKVKLFPDSEKKLKRIAEREKAQEFDIAKVSDDLKLMDDDARMKRAVRKEEATQSNEENPAQKEDITNETPQESVKTTEDENKQE
jgi:hypothetical protein